MRKVILLIITTVLVLNGFASSNSFQGIASYYGSYFHGRKTASGELYNQYKLTAAHKTLPLGTIVKVTNVANDKSVIVKINDRGPYVKGRVIDVSTKAADLLGFKQKGTAQVLVEVINPDEVPDVLEQKENLDSLKEVKDTNEVSNPEFVSWKDIPTVDDEKKSDNPTQQDVAPVTDDAILSKRYIDKSALMELLGDGTFGIDLGNFKDIKELLEVISRLEKLYNQPIYFEKIESPESVSTSYKLYVGNYKSRSYADALKIKLMPEFKDCLVVQY